MKRITSIIFLALLAHLLSMPNAFAQTVDAFEVASVRQNMSGRSQMVIATPSPGRFTATNVTPKFLVQYAYGLRDFLILGVPGWATREHFDVVATHKGDASDERTKAMVRKLLEDRLRLKVHWETSPQSVLELGFAKDDHVLGANLRVAAKECIPRNATQPAPPRPANLSGRQGTVSCGLRAAFGHLSGGGVELSEVTDALSLFTSKVVIDRTGLREPLDLAMNFTPDAILLAMPAGAQPDDQWPWPSLATAIQEQLGLELMAGTSLVRVLVVDSMTRPSSN